MSENTQKDAAPSEVNQPPVKPSPVTLPPPPPISSVPPNGTSPATSVGAPPPPPPPPPPPSSSVPPNGTSPTTSVGAPPPHAPPPPPPPPVSGNTNKTSKQKSDMENVNEKPYKVSVQDLIKGKEKLKKTDFVDLRKKVKLNMKEIFDGFQIHDYFPLSPAMKYFSYQTDKITTLNLSRIEQLTDMFFFTLDDRKIELPHCGTLTLSGCYYITDMAVVFITQGKTFTNLTSVRFTACKKITERSLHYLFDRYSEITVKMICADVSSIYGKALQSLQRLKLTGCPLISPPSYVYENQKVIFVDSTLESLKTYKIVILVDPEHKQGLMSQMLINDYVAPLRILGNWKPGKAESKKDKEPDSDSDYHFNLFEIIYEQGLEDLILNNGSIVLLPYSLTEEKVAAKLADKIKMVLSKYPETVFMLCQIDLNKSEKETGVKKDVLQTLSQTWMAKLSSELKHGEFLDGNDGDSNLSAYNFHDQQVFTIGKWCYEHLSKFLENSEDLLVECDIVDSDAMKLATTKAVEGLIKTYPWHGIQYYPLILGFLKDIVNKGFPVCPLMTVIDELPDTVRNVLNPVTCYAEMEKILELMHTRGFACFYGNIEDKPALTDLGKFEQCINNIFANPAPRQNYIKAIGLKVPCWTLEDMKKVLVDADWLLSYFNFTLFVSILEEAGCIFKFPCDMIGDDFRDSFVYVLNKDIPAEPMVPVCSVWSEVSPSQQTSKIYEFISSLNNSFFFKVIRVFSQVYRFTLLWKSGFIFHVGPIACFVEKTHIEETGVPVIFITARFDAVYHCEEWGDWEKLLMTSFNMVLTLVDSVVQKEKAFVKKCIPCPNCVDSSQMGNRRVMLNPKLCYHFTEIYSKSMEVETVRCKKELTKGIPKSMLFGPSDVSLRDFIPNHAKINKVVHVLKSDDKKLAEFSQAVEKNDIKALKTLQASALKTKDIKFRQIKDTLREPLLQFDEGIRCYLCQNCAVQGMDCPSNMFNGKTKKHCSCKHTTDMCTYCGICKNCISHLVDAFTTVQPQFDKSGSMFTIFDRKYTFTDHMNTDTFGSLEIVSLENITITAYVGEGEENIVSYNTATGMVVPKSTKSQYIARPGTRLSLCLATHPTVMEFPIYVYTLNKVLKTLHVNSVYSITMLKQLPEVKKGLNKLRDFIWSIMEQSYNQNTSCCFSLV
ncbi:hypothetical protein KUTeg_017695 [Tegillarca granosa]|uniref:Uncharacterized protein n=1 Tax=Tegillarca granosa TaxID=220873 RepID=A0ABQ9EJJ2_TEGGR|nr:hypothetical protein KUTeg_017695 [Tegillarca granosa]